MSPGLRIDPAEVDAAADQVSQAGSLPTALPGGVDPAAPDPVSVAAAATLCARAAAVAALSEAADDICTYRGALLHADAASYTAQEIANAAVLAGSPDTAAPPATVPVPPPPPAVPAPVVPPPAPAALPTDGKTIAVQIHSGRRNRTPAGDRELAAGC